jgi:hypothetical protein
MIAPTQSDTVAQLTQSLAQAPIPQADQDRKRLMRDAWKAYRGDFQPPLKVSADQPDDNVLANRCEPIVNKGVSFLFGNPLKIECPEEAVGRSDKQDYLDGLWGDDDDKMTLLAQLGINGGVCGEVFVKLIPPQYQMKYPRLVVMDPQLVRIVTLPEDCSLIVAYIIEYPGIADWQKRQVIARVDAEGDLQVAGSADIEDTWTITTYMRKGITGSWFQVGEIEEWNYPFAPIFCCQNLPNPNESWGMPDLTPDLIGQNKVLNFIESNTSRILKFHAHPKTYATGLSATQINIGVDDLICLPSPDSKLANLEMSHNLADSLNFAAVIRDNMDEQSRVPGVALGRIENLPRGNISGVALQLLFQPLIEKTVQKQRLYGRLIRDICRAALVLAGKIGIDEYEDYRIELHWQNLLPIDDLAAAQTAMLLKQLGVSTETILAELGYNASDEAEKNAEEDARTQGGAASVKPMPQISMQHPMMQQQTDGIFDDGGASSPS